MATHRFHSESLDEKLESLEAEDLMSQPSHQRITWMGAGEKVTSVIRWEWAEDMISKQHGVSSGGWHPCEECSDTTEWLSRNGKENSQLTTALVIHLGSGVSILLSMQVLRDPSCVLFLALQSRAIYKSLTSLNMKSKCAHRCNRQTHAALCLWESRGSPPPPVGQGDQPRKEGELYEYTYFRTAPLNMREDFN